MFGIGTTELLIGLTVAFLLFGNKLPGVLRSLGQSFKEFKKGFEE